MTDKTFDPTTSSYEMQVATANMQSAIIDEQNSTAQSLLISTKAEQRNGFDELYTLQGIYNGGFAGGVTLMYGEYISPTYDASGNIIYTVDYYPMTAAAPGFNTGKGHTNDAAETQSAANLAQQFYTMGNTGYDTFNQMASSMLSQDTSNSSTMAEFAKDSSNELAFMANILVSGA